MNLDKWKSQIVRGTLEYCILLMLNRKVCYGYEILQELSRYPMLASTESTVYPLLRRLQKEKYLQSTWQESAEGLDVYKRQGKGNQNAGLSLGLHRVPF